jgi:hypothetical protein
MIVQWKKMVMLASLDDFIDPHYYSNKQFFRDALPPSVIFLQNHGEGGSSFVQHRPQSEPLDDLEGFLASQQFEHRSKLDQLGVEIDTDLHETNV